MKCSHDWVVFRAEKTPRGFGWMYQTIEIICVECGLTRDIQRLYKRNKSAL